MLGREIESIRSSSHGADMKHTSGQDMSAVTQPSEACPLSCPRTAASLNSGWRECDLTTTVSVAT